MEEPRDRVEPSVRVVEHAGNQAVKGLDFAHEAIRMLYRSVTGAPDIIHKYLKYRRN
jgi:hypothetical protein